MSLEMPFGVYTINDADVDAKYRVLDDNARDSLIINKLVQIGFVIYHSANNKRYWLKAYPTQGDLTGVVWEEICSGSSVVFPENPNEGDTFISNTDYYLYENGEWLLIPNIEIKKVSEQVFYWANEPLDKPEEQLNISGWVYPMEELNARLKYMVVDVYRLIGVDGEKELMYKNIQFSSTETYNFENNLRGYIQQASRPNQSLNKWDYNVLVVFKEKINKEKLPTVTYSNYITKGLNNTLANWSDYHNWVNAEGYVTQPHKELLKQFWNLDISTTIEDNEFLSHFVKFSSVAKRLYKQLDVNTSVGATLGAYDVSTDSFVLGNNLYIVGEPKILFKIRNVPTLYLANFGEIHTLSGQDIDFRNDKQYNAGDISMALIYPCKAIDTQQYHFYVKPYGIDQAKVTLFDNTYQEKVYIEVRFKKTTKTKIFECTDYAEYGFHARLSIMKYLQTILTTKNISKIESVNIFLFDRKTKTRTEVSRNKAIFTRGINNSGSFVPKRF